MSVSSYSGTTSTGVINVFLEKLGFERVYFLAKPEFFRGIFTGLICGKQLV